MFNKSFKAILLVTLLFLATAINAAQTVTYFHNDIAGTPLIATDASGNVVWKENYYPYGERLNPETKRDNKLWFTGKPYDQDTGLTYLGARYYNPLLGRFMGIDPKGFDPENIHSFNRYAYANNNPYRYVDPDGHSPLDLGFLVYDIGKAAVAIYTGQGIGMALVDVAVSALGVISPIPGTGQALKVVRAEQRWVGVASSTHKASNSTKGTVQANKAAGDAFEQQVMSQLQQVQSGVVQQVTVKTQNGVRTRIDLMGRDAKGNIICTECKASATAPLTRNQAAAFPEIEQSGAMVVGKGKPGFQGGTQIPPTKINIIRP